MCVGEENQVGAKEEEKGCKGKGRGKEMVEGKDQMHCASTKSVFSGHTSVRTVVVRVSLSHSYQGTLTPYD